MTADEHQRYALVWQREYAAIYHAGREAGTAHETIDRIACNAAEAAVIYAAVCDDLTAEAGARLLTREVAA